MVKGYGIKKNEATKIMKELEEGKMTNLESNIKKMKEEAAKEGELKVKVETAVKMLNKNMDIKTIFEITGLSEAEIKKLKATTKKAA